MDLREFLSVPYLLEATAIEAVSGQWRVRLAYPELPGCSAEGDVVEHALRDLERCRIEIILDLIEEGQQPPVPRPPFLGADPLWTARELGLAERVNALIANPCPFAARV